MIPPEGRHEPQVEEVARVQGVVAQKLEHAAMHGVASRLGDHVDLRARPLSVFGGIRVGEDVELPHGVDSQQLSAHTARRHRELAGSGVFDAVQQEQVVAGPAPRHGKRVSVAGTGVGALHGAEVDGSGIQGNQVVEAAPVQRQILHFALAHHSRDGGGRGVDQRDRFGNGDLLDEIAHLKPKIHHAFLTDLQIDAPADRGLEPGLPGFDFLPSQR